MIWNAKNGKAPLKEGSMSYVSFGYGPRTLIILPGLSDGLATVNGKALLLARPYREFFGDFTVYMFSRKDRLDPDMSIREMASDQASVLAALNLDRVSILGVSEGGMIAQYMAIDYPDMIEKMVLAVTAPCVNETIRSCVQNWIDLAERGDHKALMIDTAERSYSQAYLTKYRKVYPILSHAGKPKSYERFLVNARAILSFDASEELCRITCPTLVLGGEEDRIVGPEASRELCERISSSELFLYPGLGHAAYEEAEDFNQRVFRFVKQSQK